MLSRSATLTSGLLLTACTVVNPAGWEARAKDPTTVTFRRAQGAVVQSASEEWPGGRIVDIEVRRIQLTHGLIYKADIEFSLAYRDAPNEEIHCRHEPSGPGVPETRFGCWASTNTTQPLEFWLAPNLECSSRNLGMARTLLRAECWTGTLSMGERNINLEHGHLKRAGSPIGRISWVSPKGAPVLVADMVQNRQLKVYDTSTTISDDVKQPLILLSIALSLYERASQPH